MVSEAARAVFETARPEFPRHDREPKQKPPGENEIKRLSSVYNFRSFTVTSCLLFFGADLVFIICSLSPFFTADTGHKSDQETSIAMFRAFKTRNRFYRRRLGVAVLKLEIWHKPDATWKWCFARTIRRRKKNRK